MSFSSRRNATARLGGKEMIRSALASGRTAARQIPATRPEEFAMKHRNRSRAHQMHRSTFHAIRAAADKSRRSIDRYLRPRADKNHDGKRDVASARLAPACRAPRAPLKSASGKELPPWVFPPQRAVGIRLCTPRDPEFPGGLPR